MTERTQQIIDKPCKRCGNRPALYYVFEDFTRGYCVPCEKTERQVKWAADEAKIAHLPLRATLNRPCKKCGASPAEYQRHSGGKDGYRATCLECLNTKTRIQRNAWDDERKAEHREQLRSCHKIFANKVRRDVFERYGMICACCGEDNRTFLTIDHVNGQGAKHRKEIGVPSGLHFYIWLRDNEWPDGYQVLCWNCNSGRHFNGGICPHEEERLRLVA